MADYSLILTKKGAELVACALAENKKITVTAMAVGDGGGSAVIPLPTATALKREVYRMTPMLLDSEAGQVIVHGIIPADEGGFAVREVGLYAEDDLVAYGNMAEMYKTTPAQGMATDYNITLYLSIDNDVITISVPPQSYATVGYVDQKIQELGGGTLNVTALNADNLTTGTVPVARLPIATTVEAQAGSITDKLLNPALLKAAMEQFGLFGNRRLLTVEEFAHINDVKIEGRFFMQNAYAGTDTTGNWLLDSYRYTGGGFANECMQIRYRLADGKIQYRFGYGQNPFMWYPWIDPFAVSTPTSKGLMSWQDKQKLDAVKSQWIGTEAEYNALPAYDLNTFYLCKQGYQITKIFLGGAEKVEPPPPEYLPITADITDSGIYVPDGYSRFEWYVGEAYGELHVRISVNDTGVIDTYAIPGYGGGWAVAPGDYVSYLKEDMHETYSLTIILYHI